MKKKLADQRNAVYLSHCKVSFPCKYNFTCESIFALEYVLNFDGDRGGTEVKKLC